MIATKPVLALAASALFAVADQLMQRSPRPTETLTALLDACRYYLSWLAGQPGARGTVD